ncbi:BON domain-containing protein [Polynucleobacter paneuropaeus]|nr:BON domain-containing protein [Polynucleobacter paneuropaeus]
MKLIKPIAMAIFSTVLLSLAACAETSSKESAGQYIDNSVLTAKVKAALYNDPSLKASEITVETFKGEVQLSGFVSSVNQAEHAVDVAKTINGVTSVKNDMRVKGTMNPFYK